MNRTEFYFISALLCGPSLPHVCCFIIRAFWCRAVSLGFWVCCTCGVDPCFQYFHLGVGGLLSLVLHKHKQSTLRSQGFAQCAGTREWTFGNRWRLRLLRLTACFRQICYIQTTHSVEIWNSWKIFPFYYFFNLKIHVIYLDCAFYKLICLWSGTCIVHVMCS